jgi:hypothetical protein
VIKTYKLAEQTGSYTPNPAREEYGSKVQHIFGTALHAESEQVIMKHH